MAFVAALMATGTAYGQSTGDRGFLASIDTAGIHEDDLTVTRGVSANIFYFLQDNYVDSRDGRHLTTALTQSVTVSVDLDTQRATATAG